jgi:hypothetical protein
MVLGLRVRQRSGLDLRPQGQGRRPVVVVPVSTSSRRSAKAQKDNPNDFVIVSANEKSSPAVKGKGYIRYFKQ